MKQILFSIFCILLTFFAEVYAYEKVPDAPQGMVSIFNGRDFTGWKGHMDFWSIKDGILRGETTPTKRLRRNTFLIYDKEVGDFDFRVSFRVTDANNSGIQYRSSMMPTYKGDPNPWRLKGYQYEIRNELRFPNVAGFLWDERGTRRYIMPIGKKGIWTDANRQKIEETLFDEKEFRKFFKLNDWNDVAIIAKGRRVKHYLNGHLVADLTDSKNKALLKGKLGLQIHAGRPMWVEFKNIRLKTY